jgi:hypothetical protein
MMEYSPFVGSGRHQPPRLKLVRMLWTMTSTSRKPIRAGIYRTEVGHELRVYVGGNENNLIESLLSRAEDHPLEVRAQELRLMLEEKGWTALL